MSKFSLNQRFSMLLAVFTSITVAVLYLLVSAMNEPINFAATERLGNSLQQSVMVTLQAMMKHRVTAQRALNGERDSQRQLEDLQKEVDAGLKDMEKAFEANAVALQFTPEGLSARKRDHLTMTNLMAEWSELIKRLSTLKSSDSNEQHAHLIADLRGIISHLGDTSNLVLDPDLDSYYLMDVTLLALPQALDRIQNVITEVEPWVRRKSLSEAERIKTSVYVSMMTEADLERIKADVQTALNEDPKFYGTMASLTSRLKPAHEKYTKAHEDFIAQVKALSEGGAVSTEEFLKSSETALALSFDYWKIASAELENLLQARIESHATAKRNAQVASLVCLLLALGLAWAFMRYLVANMRSIVEVLNDSSGRVSTASSLSASNSTELSEAATEQAASLQETMASIEQISAMVNQNAESAAKAREVVDSNRESTERGNQSVKNMTSAISEIKETNEEILGQMEASNKELGDIVKIIGEIAEKTDVINEIVFQTKLLSFNASVEAARAGEHGKGFAVVAEEIGNLAKMSGNAAREITEMLAKSTKKVNDIVQSTKEKVERLVEVGKDKIAMGQSTAVACAEALNEITVSAQTIVTMISEISNASKEQAQGIQEINKAISQLDAVTQQNTGVAHQSSTQAESLSSEAEQLIKAVSRLVTFVDGTGSPSPHTSPGAPPGRNDRTPVRVSSPRSKRPGSRENSAAA